MEEDAILSSLDNSSDSFFVCRSCLSCSIIISPVSFHPHLPILLDDMPIPGKRQWYHLLFYCQFPVLTQKNILLNPVLAFFSILPEAFETLPPCRHKHFCQYTFLPPYILVRPPYLYTAKNSSPLSYANRAENTRFLSRADIP